MIETMEQLRAELGRPVEIGGKTVANRLWLAPMAGLGHVAYRRVMARYGGCGLLFSEMCSAKGLANEKPGPQTSFLWHPEELPTLVCQIMGAQPEEMVEAAERIQDEGFFGVDINMGCSVSGIVKRRAGADLLREPDRAVAIVQAVRKAVKIPVMVKFRTGWQPEPEPGMELAKRMEQAGADAFVFHPRVAPDRRGRPPKTDHIRLIRESVSIPVFGNGDICLPEDAMRMLNQTHCDGISIGRMAISQPWMFATWLHGFEPGPHEFRDVSLAILDELDAVYEPIRAARLFKKITPYLAANFTYGSSLLTKLNKGKTTDELRANVREHFMPDAQRCSRPNSLLFNA